MVTTRAERRLRRRPFDTRPPSVRFLYTYIYSPPVVIRKIPVALLLIFGTHARARIDLRRRRRRRRPPLRRAHPQAAPSTPTPPPPPPPRSLRAHTRTHTPDARIDPCARGVRLSVARTRRARHSSPYPFRLDRSAAEEPRTRHLRTPPSWLA